MLPLQRPFDSLHAALTVLRRHPGEVVCYLGLITVAGWYSSYAADSESDEFVIAALGAILIFILLGAILGGLLVYHLHRALLENRRVTISEWRGQGRRIRAVIGRSILIWVVAAILIAPLVIGLSYFFGSYENAVAITHFGALASFGLGIYVAVLFLGIRIPHTVAVGQSPLPEPLRQGAHIRQLAWHLLAPAAILVPSEVLVYVLTSEGSEVTVWDHFLGLLTAIVTLLCTAMTAAILSDTYRRFADDPSPRPNSGSGGA
ncbi:MAG: hypothetical protein AAFR17_13680 [Pseudomonadota bacterium]